VTSVKELPVLQITNWPLRQQKRFVFVVAISILAIAILVGTVLHHWSFGALTFLALTLVTWRMWTPVRFKLDSRGIHQTVWLRRYRMPWSKIARYIPDPNGVLILHQSDAYPLSALRGTYIFGNNESEDVVRLLEFYCPSLDSPNSG